MTCLPPLTMLDRAEIRGADHWKTLRLLIVPVIAGGGIGYPETPTGNSSANGSIVAFKVIMEEAYIDSTRGLKAVLSSRDQGRIIGLEIAQRRRNERLASTAFALD